MADIVTVNFDYTYNGKESTDLIFCPSVKTPKIEQLFTVRTGIKCKEQIALTGYLSKIVKAYSSCDRSLTGTGIDWENQTLEVAELEFLIQQCKDTFECTIMGELLPDGVESFELGPKIRGWITDLIKDSLARDNFRILSFGDTTALSTDYNQLNGLWSSLMAGEAGYCVTKVDSIGCDAMASGAALTYLVNIYNGAPIQLKQVENNQKYIAVTGSVYENLLASYESNTTGSDAQFGLLQKGPQGFLQFRGIDIIPVYAWDESLLDAANPLFGTVCNLILYTTKMNHVVGMARAADQGKVSQNYRWYDRQYYFEGNYKMGYTYICCDLQAISY